MVLYRKRPLPDPVRIGLPEFDSAPLKKRLSWRPRSPQRESDRDVIYLMGRIRLLAHFGLWKRLFFLVPRSKEGSMYQVGGAEVWRIAGTGYLSGTPKKASEDWPSEWFYIEDIPLQDPVRIGLPEFDSAPLKKRLSWRPRSP